MNTFVWRVTDTKVINVNRPFATVAAVSFCPRSLCSGVDYQLRFKPTLLPLGGTYTRLEWAAKTKPNCVMDGLF